MVIGHIKLNLMRTAETLTQTDIYNNRLQVWRHLLYISMIVTISILIKLLTFFYSKFSNFFLLFSRLFTFFNVFFLNFNMDVYTSMGYTAHSHTNINRGFFGIENACSLPKVAWSSWRDCVVLISLLLSASGGRCSAQLECVAIRNLIAQDAVPVGGICCTCLGLAGYYLCVFIFRFYLRHWRYVLPGVCLFVCLRTTSRKGEWVSEWGLTSPSTEQNRTLLPQAKVLMAGCQNSQHGHLCWLPIMT